MATKIQANGKVGGESHGREGTFFKYLLTCCAATIAETDLTKTRLQIQGEGQKPASSGRAVHRGMVGTACGIVREEGVHRLWQGVSPAIYRHLVYTGSRMGFYEWIRQHILGKNPDGTYAVWKAMLSGLVAGAMAQFIASPTDLVKVQMQMGGRRLLEGHTSSEQTMRQVLRQIVSQRGMLGLWRGWVPNVQRAALVNLGDLTTYDTVKHQLLNHTRLSDNYVTHGLASCCSGLVAAILGTPADVVKTRIMNQVSQNSKPLYKSSLDCLIKTVSHEGFFALYKGFLPIWARMAPWSIIFWLSYERIRKVAGTSSF